MNRKGVTLIELMVGVAIVTVILAVAGFQFAGWQRKYNLELEIKSLYGDIQKARGDAKASNRTFFVEVNTGSPKGGWTIYEDSNNNGNLDPTPIDTKRNDMSRPRLRPDGTEEPPTAFRYAVNGDRAAGLKQVSINKSGVMAPADALQTTTLTIYDPGFVPSDPREEREDKEYDCIVIAQTRVNLGTWDGGACNAR